MSTQPSASQHPGKQPGERLMIAGGVIAAIGIVLTLVALIPLFDAKHQLPSYFWGLAMVTGIGLGVLIYGFWRAARGRSRAIRSAADDFDARRNAS